ncbi:hypothetical protein [Natronorubrum daqingense]|uniref:Uncharacterized protein n=1 Tax=Natronorubrum daqingense TaxID=588898 RepID=A0A1N7G659_9EURY|nr:hypothetical protein [Natronorubrum daqingense]APX98699.1 hypothetical protein BB347_18505 [Natronorubrum daqingense]SIS08038.1 hypothetical protein SAMN05421809_3760 [Natronorubrum daqingense]
MSEREQTFGEHVQYQTQNQQQQFKRQVIRSATERGNQAIVLGKSEQLADITDRHLVPNLLEGGSARELRRWRERIDEHEFDAAALWSFLNHSDHNPETVHRAFTSLQSIAMHRGIVDESMRNYAPVTGFGMNMGKMFKTPKYRVNGEVQIASYHAGETKTLYNGETGEGKSTALSTEVADRWMASCANEWFDGREYRTEDFKIVDLVDTDMVENGVYDIPQQQDVLRDVRSEMGFPKDYNGIDGFEKPNLELLVPLTRDFQDEEIPIGDDGDTIIVVFTIAASDLTKRSLKNFVAGTTGEQQKVIGTCYDRLEASKNDWTLKDLAKEVLSMEGINDSFKRRALHQIETLQQTGFVRDKKCPHRLEWGEVFRDTDTITAFTQKFMSEYDQKLMVLSYLFHSVYHEREGREDLPPAVAVARELHEVVPHSQESNGTEREQSLQKAIVGELSYILRKQRKQSLEFICDTQDITDIKRGIRKRFNRAVTFSTHEDALEELFDKVVGNKSLFRSYHRSIQTNTVGRGTVLGKTVPNNEDGSAFLSQVQFAPPPWHVFDDDDHDTGLHARVEYTSEEWGEHEWNTRLPDHLELDVDELKREQEADDDDGLSAKEQKDQHKKEARRRREMGESVQQVREAVPNNPNTGNPYSERTIHEWTKDVYQQLVNESTS